MRRTRISFSWMPAKINTASSQMIHEVASGRKSLARPIRKSSWSTTVPRLPIKSSTTPFQAINPASVTTNEGIPILVMISPCRVPIAMPEQSASDDGHDRAHLVAVGDQQHGGDHAGHTGHVAHRQVDLAQQQHEHDAHGDRGDRGRLDDQVDEVAGGEEAVVLGLEDDRDDDQAEDDRQRAELARADVGPPVAGSSGEAAELAGVGRGVCGGHASTSSVWSASMPGTLVSVPAVIAWTTSCSVVSVRLNSATF